MSLMCKALALDKGPLEVTGGYVLRVTMHYSMGKPLKSARRILSGTPASPSGGGFSADAGS